MVQCGRRVRQDLAGERSEGSGSGGGGEEMDGGDFEEEMETTEERERREREREKGRERERSFWLGFDVVCVFFSVGKLRCDGRRWINLGSTF